MSITYKREVQSDEVYQSFTMKHLLQLAIAGLLTCLALANALPGLFPRENITTYKYYADLKTGAIEPAPFASQFILSGLMHIRPELSIPNLKNAFYISLNVTHSLKNGEIKHFEKIPGNTFPLHEASADLLDPFIIIFDDFGKVQSLMVNKEEAEWSRNMKRSIASMLQLDLSKIILNNTAVKSHSFLTKENTIYGECTVAYDVHRERGLEDEDFTVTKISTPTSCQNFTQYLYNLEESEGCLIEKEDEMTSASRRVFHIKYFGEDLLIKTLVAHGVINYFPWRSNSEAHYVLANQTMEFLSISPAGSDIVLPLLDDTKMVMLDDVTFQKYQTPYTDFAGANLLENFNSTDEISFDELVNMLEELGNYMLGNHAEMTPSEIKKNQIVNRVINIMSYLDFTKLNNFFIYTSNNNIPLRDTFVMMIPYVGTTASCLFVKDIIIRRRIRSKEMNFLVSNLPFYIHNPTEELLINMEDLMNLSDIDENVRKSGILGFATMIHNTYKYESYRGKMNSKLVDKYVQHYFDHVMSEPTYKMKMVYLHGIRNMGINGVSKILEPIIRGELSVSEKPEHLRLHAMLIHWKTTDDFEYIHNLYWPILADTTLPLELRICAYTILIKQPPRMELMMKLYWFMVYEKNEHLYNYHYTTLRSLVYSEKSCSRPMTEMARKIFRFTRVRPVTDIYTAAWVVDYENKEFGFGESMSLMMIADEFTGSPYAGMLEHTITKRREPVNTRAFWLRMEGLDRKVEEMLKNIVAEGMTSPIEKIKIVLKKARENMPPEKPFHIEFAIIIQGRTVSAYSEHNWTSRDHLKLLSKIDTWINLDYHIPTRIQFSDLYTMQVPNDLGLPTLLRNSNPVVIGIVKNIHLSDTILHPKRIGVIMSVWSNGYYSMEVYNPIINTWHAIRRISQLEMNLPIDINFSYNATSTTFKMSSRRLPSTENSYARFQSHVQNYVMVISGEKNILARYCPSCNSAELVTQGTKYRKTTELMNFDSEDTALHLSIHRFDCERGSSPNPRFESSGDILDRKSRRSWRNVDFFGWMEFLEYRALIILNPELGSCGYRLKLGPSIVYPASSVDLRLEWNKEILNVNNFRIPPARRMDVRLKFQVNSESANTSIITWTVHGKLNTDQGNLANDLDIVIRRNATEKSDLEISIKGSKTYPKLNSDPLSPLNSKMLYKSIGELSINVSEVAKSGSLVNESITIINMESEMSSEQDEALKDLMINGECRKDLENDRYSYRDYPLIPRTPACLREAIFRSNLRKSTYTILYDKIPENMIHKLQWIADIIRADLMPYATYLPEHTKPGEIKVVVEYPLDDKLLNLVVRTPTHEINYTGISINDQYGWSDTLDNAQFSWVYLDQIKCGEIKFCTIYPKVLLNADGAVIPFTLPNKWTLLTGDYIQHTFSVFVKSIETQKLALLMSFANHTIEVVPSDATPDITLDGEVIDYESGVSLSSMLHPIQIIWSRNNSILQLEYDSFYLEWSNNFVSLDISTTLQGRVTGLCGNLNGAYSEKMSKVYTFED